MVEKKELRIGNTIRCTHHLPIGFNTPFLLHSDIVELRESLVETSEGFYKYKDIAPIPLNEDVLLKTNARKISDTEYIISKIQEHEPDIYLIKESVQFYLSTDKGGKYSTVINSLHQLQNLYFTLTGRELIVNL